MEKARAEGKPVPVPEPLLPALPASPDAAVDAAATSSAPSTPSSSPPSPPPPPSSSSSSAPSSQSSSSSPPVTAVPDYIPHPSATVPAYLTPTARARLEQRIKGLPPLQREVEIKAFLAEVAVSQHTVDRINEHREQQERAMRERRDKGQERLSDWIIRTFRF